MRRKGVFAALLVLSLSCVYAAGGPVLAEEASSAESAASSAAETPESAETLKEEAEAPESASTSSEEAAPEGGKDSSVSAMSLDEFPVMDGSLACVPMMEELLMRFTGCSEMQADERVNEYFTNTNPCYLNLAAGERDICIAYEPAQETTDELEEYDPLDMTPIGKDALVFIVNENNPVDDLTREQLTDIFTGKIRNWKEVGGDDVPIEAFIRPETSGSQTLLRKLLVGDADMTDGTYYYMKQSMEGMVEAIKGDYDNTEMAIGYSVYYYVDAMMGTGGLKFLKVDGVEPSNEAIAAGDYPLVNDFYAVTRKDSPQTALEIRDWLLSEEGQAFVQECGYVPVK